jgi:tRNA(Ile)-lysidine synthase
LHAATVDHGLRAESVREAHLVAEFCRARDIPHTIMTLGDLSGSGNLSAKARDARYAVLSDWAGRQGLAAVALGHTMDDQAETVLMRLARGSGAEGLAGMAEARDWLGVRWVRPLLSVRRADLRDWLRGQGVAWIEDPTNEDPAYERVKMRKALEVLEPLGVTVEGLSNTAAILTRQRAVLEEATAVLAGQARIWGRFGEARLLRVLLRADLPDTAMRLLADTLMRVGAQRYRPRFRVLEPLFQHLTGQGNEARTLAGCLIVPAENDIVICREPAAVAGPMALDGQETLWDGRWAVTGGAGLFVGALGAAGRVALQRAADQEGFTMPCDWDLAPSHVRETVPALYSGPDRALEELVAVPLAGYESDAQGAGVGIRFTPAMDPVRR